MRTEHTQFMCSNEWIEKQIAVYQYKNAAQTVDKSHREGHS